MTVHEDSFAHLLIKTAHILTDHEHLFFLRASQVLPVPVERGDAVRLKLLWIVTEANLVIYAVAA